MDAIKNGMYFDGIYLNAFLNILNICAFKLRMHFSIYLDYTVLT